LAVKGTIMGKEANRIKRKQYWTYKVSEELRRAELRGEEGEW
jgi:hypothetical protein